VLGVGSHQEFLAGLKQLATTPRLVLADLRQRLPAVALFSWSGQRQAACGVEALREDAAGYLEYPAPLPLLKQSLLVAAGGLVSGPRVARLLTRHFHPAPPPAPRTARTGCSFSCYSPGEAPCPALGPCPLGQRPGGF
jgi:hypothetical protein